MRSPRQSDNAVAFHQGEGRNLARGGLDATTTQFLRVPDRVHGGVDLEAGVAAISSPVAGTIYNLQVLRSGIEDHTDNTTRFLVISRTPPGRSERDITSLLFSIKRDQAGALYRALEPFAQHGVNLTRIESRPTRVRAWEYVFFCDFEGHSDDEAVGAAIAELRPRCDFVKVLGSYPQAEAVS